MEKSTLDKETNFIDDEIIKLKEDANNADTPDELSGVVKDGLDDMIEKENNIQKEKDEKDKKFEEEQKRYEKDIAIRKRKEFWKSFYQKFLSVVSFESYAKVIQSFESLLFVIFVDIVLLSILFSILYGVYIILNFDINNYAESTFKFGGTILICIIGIIIQVNLNSRNETKTGDK